ncbi:unnamed protein product [Rotaria sp. Silwood2]|nr:unnamed protein product [Rotaria sp. Silwood2]
MEINEVEYKSLRDKFQSIENELIQAEKNLQMHQKELETDREKLKKLSVDHRNLLPDLSEAEAKLRQIIEEVSTTHLKL